MSWTWSYEPELLLSRYPSLANSQVLKDQWPAFRMAVERQAQDDGKSDGNGDDSSSSGGSSSDG